jgi:hypothetical protein
MNTALRAQIRADLSVSSCKIAALVGHCDLPAEQ